MSLKVLFCQGLYGGVSGEDRMATAWVELLKLVGHEVEAWTPEFPSARSLLGAMQKGLTWVGNPLELSRFASYLKTKKPDLVIFGNLESLSPFAVSVAAANKIPAIVLVHNFRMVCSTGTLFRDGQICTACPTEGNMNAIRSCCANGSLGASSILALRTELHLKLNSYSKAAICITPSQFLAKQLQELGMNLNFESIPNWISSYESEPILKRAERRNFLFVGRLDKYKGVADLLNAWQNSAAKSNHQLLIAGAGAEQELVLNAARSDSSIRYLGPLEPPQVRDEMNKALAVLVPSTWWEPFGLVAIEAFSTGTPVITSGRGALAEVVPPECGATVEFSRPSSFDDGLNQVEQQWQSMSTNAFRRYSNFYSIAAAKANVANVLSSIKSLRGSEQPNQSIRLP